MLQLQTSPDQFLMFLIKAKTVLLLLITSGVLFQSVLPMNDIEFMPKGDFLQSFTTLKLLLF